MVRRPEPVHPRRAAARGGGQLGSDKRQRHLHPRRLIHGSHVNTSDQLRWGSDFRYQPVGTPTDRPQLPVLVVSNRVPGSRWPIPLSGPANGSARGRGSHKGRITQRKEDVVWASPGCQPGLVEPAPRPRRSGHYQVWSTQACTSRKTVRHRTCRSITSRERGRCLYQRWMKRGPPAR